MANDEVQIRLQDVLRDYRIGYERKEGEKMERNGYELVFSKEDGALAFLASFQGHGAKLWGSLGRAKLFGREEDYGSIFPREILTDESKAKTRSLELAAAHLILTECRKRALKPTKAAGKEGKAKLRKARYYLARIVFVKGEKTIRDSIATLRGQNGSANEVQQFSKAIREQVDVHFPKAAELLETALAEFQAKHGGDLDVALKNEEFARLIHSKMQTT